MKAFIALCCIMLAAAVIALAKGLPEVFREWREAERIRYMDLNCCGCRNYLGGGHCRINLEKECAYGDFEAYEEAENAEP